MPIDVNTETLNYLRAELADSVRKSAEDTLFRFYRNAFALIVAVLAAVGVTIGWPTFKAMVQSEIQNGVREPVDLARKSAADMQARVSRIEAEADVRLDLIKTELLRADQQAKGTDDRLRKAKADVEDASRGFDTSIARIKDEFGDIEAAVASRSQSLGDRFAPAGGYNTLLRQVADLSTQVQKLDLALRSLAADLGKSSIVSATTELPEKVQTIQTVVSAQSLPSVQKTTVFVQFAGGPRSQITALTTILKDRGYAAPGEERLGEAAGKHEIRYYYADDAETAAKLKTAVEEAMAQLHFPSQPITLSPLLGYAKKPQRNVMELWLEIPPA